MKQALSPLARLALAAIALTGLALPARATTYVMMADEALADQAEVVSMVRVVAVEPAPTDRPATDYLVELDRVVKGHVPGSTVVVRVPGGVRPDGVALEVLGAPEFSPGERALLFLAPAEDGTYRILHLMLGAFHERRLGAKNVGFRELSEAHELRLDAEGGAELREGGADLVRSLDEFADWIEDYSAGVERPRDYVLPDAVAGDLERQAQNSGYTLMTGRDGKPIRWFRFDHGGAVAWQVHAAGQPGLGLDRSVAAFTTAMAAWTSDPATNVDYRYAGTTDAAGGLETGDDVNVILFDDPSRDHVEGTFSCGEGGVIAAGGPYYYLSTRPFRGRQYHEAAEADIVTNDGTACFFRDSKVAEEVFAHELGHTLGLGHSTTPGALMRSHAYGDGRGARVSDDDLAGLASLYGTGAPGGGDDDQGGDPVRPPAPPARLVGQAVSASQARLTWRDKAANEAGFVVEVKTGKGAFRELLAVPADTAAVVVEGLQPGRAYVFRVRAQNAAGLSRPSNNARVVMPRRR